MAGRSDGVGVLVRYELPDQEWRALARIARARGGSTAPGDVMVSALCAWVAAGNPAPRAPDPPACERALTGKSLACYQVLCWWLRREEARTVLAPRRLAQEAREAAGREDLAGIKAALEQLARIYRDVQHPDCIEAGDITIAMAEPEDRAQLVALRDLAVLAARGGQANRAKA